MTEDEYLNRVLEEAKRRGYEIKRTVKNGQETILVIRPDGSVLIKAVREVRH